jgi:hypothetical protein
MSLAARQTKGANLLSHVSTSTLDYEYHISGPEIRNPRNKSNAALGVRVVNLSAA